MARLTEKAVAEQIGKLKGNTAAIARAFGVTRQAVAKYIAGRPALASLLKDAREEMLDNAVSALHKAVLAGEAWAVCFLLKTQGKDRGYIERSEVKTEHGEQRHTVTVVVKRDRSFFGGRSPAPGADAAPDSDPGEPVPVQGGGVRPAVGQNGVGPHGGG